MSIAYKRVLLKLSGEALSGKDGIINYEYIQEVGTVVRRCVEEGAQIAIVVGAGNMWGCTGSSDGGSCRWKPCPYGGR